MSGEEAVRIITGKFKGRQLVTVPDGSVRPATDRVKSTIFNVLQTRLDLRGIAVLDLFAGSGSLGFEALSRGARLVTFVDDQPTALASIQQNAEKLGCFEQCSLIRYEAMGFMKNNGNRFGLVFADPPYAFTETAAIPRLIREYKLLDNGGFLIIEHPKRLQFPGEDSSFIRLQKDFGHTRVTFFQQPE